MDIEALALEAAEPKRMDSKAWQFVNVEVLAALVAEQCAQIADDTDTGYGCGSCTQAADAIRAAFPMPKG